MGLVYSAVLVQDEDNPGSTGPIGLRVVLHPNLRSTGARLGLHHYLLDLHPSSHLYDPSI